MQKDTKPKSDITLEELAAYEESFEDGMWEHLAGYSLDELEKEQQGSTTKQHPYIVNNHPKDRNNE